MGPGRWELLRALGMVAADPAAAGEVGLEPVGTTEHDEVFTVNCPPFASRYLGDEDPGGPAESDHLAVLLGRYAALGEAGQDDARRVLFGEILWPWLPAYLGAVHDLPTGPLTRWAELTLDALWREREQDPDPAEPLPRALCAAPPPAGLDALAEGLLTPLRSGMILTRRAVAAGAEQVGAGQRIGNRRRALAAMLTAEPQRAARWLAGEADRWALRHGARPPGAGQDGTAGADLVQLWWAERAADTARLLRRADAPLGSDAALRAADELRGGDALRGGDVLRGVQEPCLETGWVSAAD